MDEPPGLVWVAAILLTALSVIGMWSIGFLIAPAAMLLLAAAVLIQFAGGRRAVQANPPPVRDLLLKAGAGLAAVAVGAWLIYGGALTRELFGACATETLACALANLHWGGAGLTIIGLAAIGFGGWLCWKQIRPIRVLAAGRAG